MSPTTLARVVTDVIDDVVFPGLVDAFRHVIEIELMANLPGDVMILTGTVATDAKPSEKLTAAAIKRQPSAEHVDPADLVLEHGIAFRARVA